MIANRSLVQAIAKTTGQPEWYIQLQYYLAYAKREEPTLQDFITSILDANGGNDESHN